MRAPSLSGSAGPPRLPGPSTLEPWAAPSSAGVAAAPNPLAVLLRWDPDALQACSRHEASGGSARSRGGRRLFAGTPESAQTSWDWSAP
eukprot:scaffold2368_cov248-Pinguiococcus_pyrenoidosus.AAC.5